MLRYVWSPLYEADIGAHVFPTDKYRRLVDRLRAEDDLTDAQIVQPELAGADLVTSVHHRAYYERVRDGRLSPVEVARLELPWSEGLYRSAAHSVQGSLLAAEMALAHGVGLHIGGGFHHAYPDHGEGFCVFNDHGCAIRALLAASAIRSAIVIDVDVHQGNGTAAIFASDPSVSTFSIHQQDIYPLDRPPSTLDIELRPGTGDAEYLRHLTRVECLLGATAPDLAVLVAGADPYAEDQLGGLALSKQGLRDRDRYVVDQCATRGIPLLVVLAGGYARRVADTVDIHLTTLREAARLWREPEFTGGTRPESS